MHADRIFEGLNPEQRRAVEAVRGPVCILAGAGSGKTTTITRRIANQIASEAFEPARILAVTFTDKAAGELRQRLAALGVPRVEARTFHSAALAQLSQFGGGAPGQILASKAMPLRQIANALPRPYRFRPAADLATEIEWAKNRRISATAYLGSLDEHQPPIPPDLMAGVFHRYERSKQHRNMIDFEDLLELAVGLFDTNPAAAQRFRERYAAFTVDEYQDVNLLQQTLLERWLDRRDEICAVGDDYQSIYGFTGATPQYLVQMPDRYPGATVVRLERNYRSSPQILALANRLVPRLGGVPKTLRSERPEGSEPVLRGFLDPAREMRFLSERVLELHRAGVAYEEMAVLYRLNSRSEDVEEALTSAGVPFQVRDGAFMTRQAARGVLRRLRQPTASDVAAAVAEAARAEGFVEDTPDGIGEQEATRQADLARLVRLAAEYGQGSVGGFVEDLRARFASEGDGRGVNLLTYHRAKGLEFDAVFLPRLEEGEMPFKRSTSGEAVAEERRLLYVGITRARLHLFLTWTMPGRTASRFLDELQPGSPAPSRATAPAAVAARLPDDPLVRALKAWRLERSRADDVPAYVVFHDRTLAEIAARRPRSLAELSAVSGVGPSKLDRYGGEVLEVVRTTGPD